MGTIRWGLTALMAAALMVLVGVSLLARDEASFAVRGGSMEPALPLGSLIRVVAVPVGQISAGDIVSVRGDNGVVLTHRVVRIVEAGGDRYFELKGDANPGPDAALVPARAIVGRVEHFIPYAGYLAAMVGMPAGLLTVVALFGSALLGVRLLRDLEQAADSSESTPALDAAEPFGRPSALDVGSS